MRPAPLLAVALACSPYRTPAFTAPEDGGPPWTELRSPHFIVRSDLPAREARALTESYERIYSALEDVAFEFVTIPTVRTSVVAFRNRQEFAGIGPPGASVYYVHRTYHDDDRLPSLFVVGKSAEPARLVLQHELAHRFLHFYLPNAPPWLAEGLAEFVSTMAFESDKLVLGRPLPELQFRSGAAWTTTAGLTTYVAADALPADTDLLSATPPTVADLLEGNPADFRLRTTDPRLREADTRRVNAHHAASWALVHVLHNGPYPAHFTTFLDFLGQNIDPRTAWQQAFATIPPSQIEADYQAFLHRRATPQQYYTYTPRDAALESERTLSPLEVHLLWAAMRPWNSEKNRRLARIQLGLANQLAPGSPDILHWRARLDRVEGRLDVAERGLLRALDVAPDDEQLLLELFLLMAERADQQPREIRDLSALELWLPRLERHARGPAALHTLATHYLKRRNQPTAALPLAERAVNLDHACSPCLATLAAIHHALGAPTQALAYQTRALNTLPDGTRDDTLLAQWNTYRNAASATP